MRYNRRRIVNESHLLDHLRNLGGVELDQPRKRFGFEQRLERADRRPRTGEGSYIGHLADEDFWEDSKTRS